METEGQNHRRSARVQPSAPSAICPLSHPSWSMTDTIRIGLVTTHYYDQIVLVICWREYRSMIHWHACDGLACLIALDHRMNSHARTSRTGKSTFIFVRITRPNTVAMIGWDNCLRFALLDEDWYIVSENSISIHSSTDLPTQHSRETSVDYFDTWTIDPSPHLFHSLHRFWLFDLEVVSKISPAPIWSTIR